MRNNLFVPRPLHAGEEWGDEDCAEDWETTAGWFIGGDKDGTAICTSLGDDWFERPLQAGLPALIQRFLWSFWALISSPLSFWNLRLLAPQNGAHRLAQTEISIQPNPILSTYSSGAGKQDKTRWKCSFKRVTVWQCESVTVWLFESMSVWKCVISTVGAL